MEDDSTGEFNIHEAADEIIADGDSQSDSTNDSSLEGQAENASQNDSEEKVISPEEILAQVGKEDDANPAQFAELLKGINGLGAMSNGQPITIDSMEHLKKMIEMGSGFYQKTEAHAEQVKTKDAEYLQKETHFKEREGAIAQKEQEISETISINSIMGSIVQRLQTEDPELFEHLDKLYRGEEENFNRQNSYKSEVQNELKSRDERINSLAQKIESKEKTEIRQGYEKELSEVQTRLGAPLAKLGVKVDWDKVKKSWESDASSTLSVEQAMYAAYGKEIASANDSHKKLLTTKAKIQEKLTNRTGVTAGHRGGETPREVAPGDYSSILREAALTM